jgi:DNA-binding transcriptional LysR family regulator
LHRRVACEVDTIPDLVELVALGVGVSLVPPAAIRMAAGRTIGLATDPSIPRDLVLVTPLDREPLPAAVAFLQLLESALSDEGKGSALHQPVGGDY